MGPVGKDKLVFDTTVTLSENDNVGAYLTDAAGNLLTSTLVGAKQSLDVNVTDSPDQYAEDSAHVSGDIGSFALGVRNDGVQATATVGPNTFTAVNYGTSGNSISLVFDGVATVTAVTTAWNGANPNNQVTFTGSGATVPTAQTVNLTGGAAAAVTTSAHGDYSQLSVNQYGQLNVNLATITSTTGLLVDPSTPSSWGIFAEDSASASGDKGIGMLAVRNDVEGSLVSADGDYGHLQLDALGRLRVAADISVTNGFEKLEDSAHSSGDVGGYMLSVRQDTLASSTSADGDYQSFKTDSVGSLWVRQSVGAPANAAPDTAILSTSTNVDNTAGGTAIPATPLASRKSIIVQNLGNKEIFIGPSGVTTATGLRIAAGGNVELAVGPSIALYAIGATASVLAVKTFEIS